eukprot:CAMPEP_0197465890 /NCGR_PEP_ID=MMETSP1175-20131217/64772_1 /TAXON_ID=1003142 /ORGANISM="Triceratium dubium, Strain CCMP147" /LENGTH=210 /DNA_ID=CAMNT_0043001913 /DNA_START=115 /DNA_END=747 /DNA_ORIENTATION=+
MVRSPLSILFAAFVVVKTQAINFVPEVDAEDGRRLGGGKYYGHFQDELSGDLCIEVKGGKTDNLTKLWWNKCKKGKKSQLWRFDKVTNNCSDNLTKLWWNKCKEGKKSQLWRFDRVTKNCAGRGKIHSKLDDDKCIQVNKKYKPLTRLRLYDCKSKRDHQKWNYCDGDGISPKKADDLLVYSPNPEGAKRYDPLVISDRDTYSIDFTRDP